MWTQRYDWTRARKKKQIHVIYSLSMSSTGSPNLLARRMANRCRMRDTRRLTRVRRLSFVRLRVRLVAGRHKSVSMPIPIHNETPHERSIDGLHGLSLIDIDASVVFGSTSAMCSRASIDQRSDLLGLVDCWHATSTYR
jgi:hypothetical protein